MIKKDYKSPKVKEFELTIKRGVCQESALLTIYDVDEDGLDNYDDF